MHRHGAALAALLPILAARAEAPDLPRLLPRSLIVSYYGNPLSTKMGILGELPPEPMMERLAAEAELWRRADPSSRVRPALELVAAVASEWPGPERLYRTQMPAALIEKVIRWARSRRWLTILDVQVGRSTVRREVARLRPYLSRPDVHLAIDPEFQMKRPLTPGQRIGSSDAEDVNVAILELARIVEAKRLPPKILLVHRFTDGMLRRYDKIRLDPRVQVVVVMDGFGNPYSKERIYRREVSHQPVQFGGIKLFYKADQPMMGRSQILKLEPKPRVVIYQ